MDRLAHRDSDAADIIDAHVHIWADDRSAYPHVDGHERPLTATGSAEQLLASMDECGVAGALLVQAPWYGEDNRYFAVTRRRHPGRFVALGYLPDPLASDAPEKLSRQFHDDGCRGVRVHLLDGRIAAGLDTGRADPLIRRAGELGVPVQFLTREPARHELIFRLARRFPDVVFINDHLGHPRIGEGDPYPSSRAFFDCGARPNVFAKLSLHYLLSGEGYPWADLHDFQQRTVAAYGAQRLLWGSNFPMHLPTPSYRERLDAVRRELSFLTKNERSWILGQTARSLWTFTGAGPDESAPEGVAEEGVLR